MALQGFVKDYMIRDVFTIKPEDDILEALKTIVMGIDQLPVINHKETLIGMITWQDISEKVILKDQNPKKVKVQNIMKTKITTLSPKDPIQKALKLLTIGRFSLPVVENKKLIGLLSFMDILKLYLKVVSSQDD
jgi:predicted transcriptional regulator